MNQCVLKFFVYQKVRGDHEIILNAVSIWNAQGNPDMSRHKKGFDKKNIFDRYNPDYTVIIVHCISSYSMRIIITI